MVKIFDKLPTEKKERIINEALKEFTRNGYNNASTNVIVQSSGISKGSLFKYFTTKKMLYYYLYDYVESLIHEIYSKIDLNITDFFDRLRNIGEIKFEVWHKHPDAFNFLKVAGAETSSEVKEFIKDKFNKVVNEGFINIYKGIDYSKFRDDIDLEMTIKMINYTLMGIVEEQRDNLNSFSDIDKSVLDEYDKYFELMINCFYKK